MFAQVNSHHGNNYSQAPNLPNRQKSGSDYYAEIFKKISEENARKNPGGLSSEARHFLQIVKTVLQENPQKNKLDSYTEIAEKLSESPKNSRRLSPGAMRFLQITQKTLLGSRL
jgi:hypothetical protein